MRAALPLGLVVALQAAALAVLISGGRSDVTAILGLLGALPLVWMARRPGE